MRYNDHSNKGPSGLLKWIVILIIIIFAYYFIGIKIANSDMDPWLKFFFLS